MTDGHWCAFCQTYHSSVFCYHPGNPARTLEELRREWERARAHPIEHYGEADHPERGAIACVTLHDAEQIVAALTTALAAKDEEIAALRSHQAQVKRAEKAEADADTQFKLRAQAEAEVQRLRVAEAEAMNILEGTELKLEQAEAELERQKQTTVWTLDRAEQAEAEAREYKRLCDERADDP